MRRRFRLVALLMAFVLFTGLACGDDDDGDASSDVTTTATTTVDATDTTAADDTTTVETTTDTAAASSAPPSDSEGCTEDRKGGELTMGTLLATTSLDPTVALGSGSAGAIELTALYDTLLRYDPATGEYVPHVAESFESNDDLTEWTITLREGITFGNGDPLTTEAVRYTLERMKQARVSSAQAVNQIAEMEIVDDLTIVLRLTEPAGDFAYVLAEDAGNIVNPAVVEALGPEAFGINPAGAGVGPYEIERFAPNEEVVMRAKDDYWGGPVCIDTLRFVSVTGGQATYEAFQAGELDMGFMTDAQAVATAKADGVEGYSNVAGAATFLLMNNGIGGSTAATTDLRVRQAIAGAIDLDVLNDRVEGGTGLATSLLVHADSPIAPEGVDEIPFDPEASSALIEEVKAETGWDGSIRLLGGDTPVAMETTITLEAMLEAVGIDVTVENLPSAAVNERIVVAPNYDLALFGMSIFEESPMARLNQWKTGSTRSRAGYANPAMDAALDQMQRAVTRDEKRAAVGEVQQVWNETVPSTVLFAREEFVATADNVAGLVYTRDTVPMFHAAYIGEP